ncbi:MAG: MFS transporter [Pseudomonadota bacterium]|nr:MFS transporter [Pseudomonadota bacterium]
MARQNKPSNGLLGVVVVCVSLWAVAAGVNLQVPYFRTYLASFEVGEGAAASVFGAYILGLLPVLMLLGDSINRWGARNTVRLALILAGAALVIIMMSQEPLWLYTVRVLQGAAFGLIIGASAVYLGRYLQHATKTANVHGALVASGLGGGALLTSVGQLVVVSDPPASYWLVLGLVLACLLGSTWVLEEKEHDDGADQSRPGTWQQYLPVYADGVWAYGLYQLVGWSLVGIMIAVVTGELERNGLESWTGTLVFLSVATGAVVQPLCRGWTPLRNYRWGACVFVSSYSLLVLSVLIDNLSVMLLSAALAGAAGLGFIYVAGVSIMMQVSDRLRPRALSGYFLLGYLGLGTPCVAIGALTDAVGLVQALTLYGISVVALMVATMMMDGHRAIRHDRARETEITELK